MLMAFMECLLLVGIHEYMLLSKLSSLALLLNAVFSILLVLFQYSQSVAFYMNVRAPSPRTCSSRMQFCNHEEFAAMAAAGKAGLPNAHLDWFNAFQSYYSQETTSPIHKG